MLSPRASKRPSTSPSSRVCASTLYTTLDRSDRARGGLSRIPPTSAASIGRRIRPERRYGANTSESGRSLEAAQIEELVELPLMSDPDLLATLDVLTEVVPPALFTDENLSSLVICRMVNLSLEHGNSDGSCFAYVWLGHDRRTALRQLQGRISIRPAWL